MWVNCNAFVLTDEANTIMGFVKDDGSIMEEEVSKDDETAVTHGSSV